MNKLLSDKGISDEIIKSFKIKAHPNIIYFPIFDKDNNLLFTKTRYKKQPEMNPKGSHNSLYGIHTVTDKTKRVLICEGSTDMLAAQSLGITAITATSGVMSFKEEWVDLPELDKDIYICFDYDIAGHNGMARMYKIFPNAKFVFLGKQDGVKNKGDLSDYITSHSKEEVIKKLLSATTVPEGFVSELGVVFTTIEEAPITPKYKPQQCFSNDTKDRIEQARAVPFEQLLSIKNNKATCPFHNDTHASFMYWRKHNMMKCFACHNKAMDTITFIQKRDGKTFWEALETLVGSVEVEVKKKIFG